MYRVIQEGLTNAVKHSQATHVRVRLSDRAGAIDLMVHDDGKGFDPTRVSVGFGLLGMRERLALVHGTLTFASTPDAGTTMRASIPAATPGTTGGGLALRAATGESVR